MIPSKTEMAPGIFWKVRSRIFSVAALVIGPEEEAEAPEEDEKEESEIMESEIEEDHSTGESIAFDRSESIRKSRCSSEEEGFRSGDFCNLCSASSRLSRSLRLDSCAM
jgi:hypothetical protein